VAEVPADLDPQAADCALDAGETGTGFLNSAQLGSNGEVRDDQDCVELPVTTFDKQLVSRASDGNGGYTLTYELTVTRAGDGPVYDLTDTFRFGHGVAVVGQPTVTAPAGVAPNPSFDGRTNTVIAADVAIADGDTHVYTVVVDVTVNTGEATFE